MGMFLSLILFHNSAAGGVLPHILCTACWAKARLILVCLFASLRLVRWCVINAQWKSHWEPVDSHSPQMEKLGSKEVSVAGIDGEARASLAIPDAADRSSLGVFAPQA